MEPTYTFEEMFNHEHRYQVRLNGEFVCYTSIKSVDLVDQELQKAGFKSRQDFLDHCNEQNQQFLENN